MNHDDDLRRRQMLRSQLSSERGALLLHFVWGHVALVLQLVPQLQHGHLYLPQLLTDFVAHERPWRGTGSARGVTATK